MAKQESGATNILIPSAMKTLKLLYLLTALIIVIVSCKKDEPPEVETLAVNDITHTSALGGGLIINSGSEPILRYGLCWTTSHQDPTINDQKTVGQGQKNEFSAV
jgi:hypothetical protein